MDNYSNGAAKAQFESHNPVAVAASLRDDFSGLVAVFDRHLSRPLSVDAEATLALSEAKSAAQRGLELSHRLISLLRSPVQ